MGLASYVPLVCWTLLQEQRLSKHIASSERNAPWKGCKLNKRQCADWRLEESLATKQSKHMYSGIQSGLLTLKKPLNILKHTDVRLAC